MSYERFHWQRMAGPTRLMNIEADVLHCRGYIIIPDVHRGKVERWRLYAPTNLGTMVYERYSNDLRALKDEARRHWMGRQLERNGA